MPECTDSSLEGAKGTSDQAVATRGITPQLEHAGGVGATQATRYVYSHSEKFNDGFIGNEIYQAKYNMLTFLPLFLFEQLSRFANLYFIFVSVLQCFPQISITGGIPTSLVPLTIVLAFDGVVTAIEDYRRHLDDDRTNRQATLASRRQEDGSWAFEEVEWQDVSVGDILKIRRGDTVAADCVFLRSASSDGETPDRCYVMTAQLDGETNLKLRRAPKSVARALGGNDDTMTTARVALECEQPTASFSSFAGTMWINPPMQGRETCDQDQDHPNAMSNPGGGGDLKQGCSTTGEPSQYPYRGAAVPAIPIPAVSWSNWCLGRKGHASFTSTRRHVQSTSTEASGISVEAEHLLLRGVQLRSVDHAYGLVVYTGKETKAQVKQGGVISKLPQTESALNRFILYLTLALVALCTFGTVAYTIWIRHSSGDSQYLDIDGYQVLDGVRKVGTFFLLNATTIPVSLYVSIRTARTLQMILMERDSSMAYEDAEAVRAEAQAVKMRLQAAEPTKQQLSSAPTAQMGMDAKAQVDPIDAAPARSPAAQPENGNTEKASAPTEIAVDGSSMSRCLACIYSIIGPPVRTGPGRYPLKVRSMDLNDELGQITHIFSDKTGTLTLNKMEFRSLMVGSVTYGVGSASLRKALQAAGQQLDAGSESVRTADYADDTPSRSRSQQESSERKDEREDDASTVAASQRGEQGARLLIAPHVRFTDGSKSHPGRSLEMDACMIRPEAPWWTDYHGISTAADEGDTPHVGSTGCKYPVRPSEHGLSPVEWLDNAPSRPTAVVCAAGERSAEDSPAPSVLDAVDRDGLHSGTPALAVGRSYGGLIHDTSDSMHLSELPDMSPMAGDEIHEMLLHLALNHSVVPEKSKMPDGFESATSSGSLRPLRLSASSPDEEAFVYFAGRMGYTLVDRRQDVIELEIVRPAVGTPPRNETAAHGYLARGSSGMSVDAGGMHSFRVPSTGRLHDDTLRDGPVRSARRQSIGSLHFSVQGDPTQGVRSPGEWLHHAGALAAAVYGDGSPYLSKSNEAKWAAVAAFEASEPPPGILRVRRSFKLLHILPYNQMRKRMSVIVRHPSGRVSLYCKGADSTILARLRRVGSDIGLSQAESDQRVKDTDAQLSAWGADGLRTLVFACRSMAEDEVASFSQRYQAALASISEQRNRKAGLPNTIDQLMDEVERDLSLQGATANEDKLQVGVPDTIATLARAGVRTWMLTGDKEETAVNIGYATRLLRAGMRVVHASTLSRSALQGSRAVVALARESSHPPGRQPHLRSVSSSEEEVRRDEDGLKDHQHASHELDQEMGVPAAMVPSPQPGSPVNLVSAQHRGAQASMGDIEMSTQEPRNSSDEDEACTSPRGGTTLNVIQLQVGASAGAAHASSGQRPRHESNEGKAHSASASDEEVGTRGRVLSHNSIESTVPSVAEQQIHRSRSMSAESGRATPTPQSTTRARQSTLASIFRPDGGESDEDGFDAVSHHSDDMQPSRGDLGVLLGDGLLETVGLARQPSPTTRSHVQRPQSTAGDSLRRAARVGALSTDDDAKITSSISQRLPIPVHTDSIARSKSSSPSRGQPPARNGAPIQLEATLTPDDKPGVSPCLVPEEEDLGVSLPGSAPRLQSPGSNRASSQGLDKAIRESPSDTDEAHRGPVAIVIDEAVIDVMLGGADRDEDSGTKAADMTDVLLHPDDEIMLVDTSDRGQRWRARALAAALRRADAVICCRCRPDQKAALVKLIRDKVKRSRTLAIGDGANDVAMIREAHIGIGIAGREGMQAANAGDYAIGRFRLLKRLLLWHGRRNYIGMSKLVLFILWKNFLFVMAQFFYGLENGWSGQKYYIESGAQAYNLIYTSVPILLLATMDYDVSAKAVFRLPWLYREGQAGKHLNTGRLAGWMFMGLGEAAIIYFIVRSAYYIGGDYGQTPYIFQLGLLVLTSVIVLVNLRVAAEANSHTWLFQLMCALGVIFWIPALYVADAWDDNGMRGGATRFWVSGAVIFSLPLVLVLSFLRTILWKFYKRLAGPELRHIAQEAEWVLNDVESLREELEYRFLSRGGTVVADDMLNASEDGASQSSDDEEQSTYVAGATTGASPAVDMLDTSDSISEMGSMKMRSAALLKHGHLPQLAREVHPRKHQSRRSDAPNAKTVSSHGHPSRPRVRSHSFNSIAKLSIRPNQISAAQRDRKLQLRRVLDGINVSEDPTEAESPFESPSLPPSKPVVPLAKSGTISGGISASPIDKHPSEMELPPSRAAIGSRSASFGGRGDAALSLADRRAQLVLDSSLSGAGAAGTTMTEDAGTAFFVSQNYSSSGITSQFMRNVGVPGQVSRTKSQPAGTLGVHAQSAGRGDSVPEKPGQ